MLNVSDFGLAISSEETFNFQMVYVLDLLAHPGIFLVWFIGITGKIITFV